jgi:hypothetical protein
MAVFSGLSTVLEKLYAAEGVLLPQTLVFLIQRSLGRLQPQEPLEIGSTDERDQASASAREGMALVTAAGASQGSPNVDTRPVFDELEILLELCRVDLLEGCRFADRTLSREQVRREYHELRQIATADLDKMALFPRAFRERWQQLMQSAEEERDPLRRLHHEMSVMRVIRTLYALALGLRARADFPAVPDKETEFWLAYTMGEADLGQG